MLNFQIRLFGYFYIDLCAPMLDAGFEKFYSEDPLHMNVLGYSLLSKLIRDEISKFTI